MERQRISWGGGRLLTIVPSLLLAHIAWHWEAERAAVLKQRGWPFEASARGLAVPALLAMVAAGAVFLAVRWLRRRAATAREARTGAAMGER